MAVIGNSPTQQSFIPAIDYFSGNGSTTAFTLSRPVASVAQVVVVIDNVPQNPSTAFSITGNTITFTSAPLTGSNNIYIYYTSPITNVIAPSDGTVKTSSLATGAVTAAKIADANVTQSKLASGVAGNGPAFSAYQNVAQSISNNTNTKVTIDTKEFDTNSNYNNTTNYRFTPTVAGYYQVNAAILFGFSTGSVLAIIYKNGAGFKRGSMNSGSATGTAACVSALIFMNGSTDYLEFYVNQSQGTTQNTASGSANNYFQASLVRSA